MHRNIVAPTRYWHDYCARILVTWSEACSNGSLPDHLLVSFVYITEYVGLWLFYFYFSSFQSKAITMFRLPPSISFCVQFFFCSFCVCFFFLRLSGEQVNSKNVCIFPLVINVLCALLAVYANDIVDQLRDDGKQKRPAFNTLMGYRRSISLGSSLTKIQIKLCAAHVHTSEKRKKIMNSHSHIDVCRS